MKIIFFANTEWYLYNFRLGLARYLQAMGHEVVMMSPIGKYGPKLEAAGFRWIGLPMNRRSLNPIRELKLLNMIRKVYQQEQPDVVHNFTIKCVVYGSLIARLQSVRARIHAITGLGHVFISGSIRARLLRPLVRWLLRLALGGERSILIVQNPDDQQLFLEQGLISSEHIRLIKGSGVDAGQFAPVGNKRGKTFKVLLASRLLWEKGIREYVEAAGQLNRKLKDIEFLLAGDMDPGNPSSVSQSDIDEWQQSGCITMLGHVDDMPQLMQQVDLAVLPSHREGLPRGLIEAASMELPIVTTDAPGCREIVEDGVNGILVSVGDANALANAIEYLYEHPEVCEQYGKAGRLKVLRELDQDIVFEQTRDVYRELGVAG